MTATQRRMVRVGGVGAVVGAILGILLLLAQRPTPKVRTAAERPGSPFSVGSSPWEDQSDDSVPTVSRRSAADGGEDALEVLAGRQLDFEPTDVVVETVQGIRNDRTRDAAFARLSEKAMQHFGGDRLNALEAGLLLARQVKDKRGRALALAKVAGRLGAATKSSDSDTDDGGLLVEVLRKSKKAAGGMDAAAREKAKGLYQQVTAEVKEVAREAEAESAGYWSAVLSWAVLQWPIVLSVGGFVVAGVGGQVVEAVGKALGAGAAARLGLKTEEATPAKPPAVVPPAAPHAADKPSPG